MRKSLRAVILMAPYFILGWKEADSQTLYVTQTATKMSFYLE